MERLTLVIAFFCVPCLCLGATGNIEVHMNGPGQDVVFLNDWNTMEIWIENTDLIYAMLLSFELTWTDNYHVIILDDNRSGECGCDFIDATQCFFWTTGLYCWNAIDGHSSDGFRFGGISVPLYGIPPGESRKIYSIRFFFAGPASEDELCVRPYAYSEGTNWEFCCSPSGYTPDFHDAPVSDSENPDAPPVCFDVTSVPQVLCGDANCSDRVDIDDVVYLIGYIFSSGPPPCFDCD